MLTFEFDLLKKTGHAPRARTRSEMKKTSAPHQKQCDTNLRKGTVQTLPHLLPDGFQPLNELDLIAWKNEVCHKTSKASADHFDFLLVNDRD
jgi:hypothetical protein